MEFLSKKSVGIDISDRTIEVVELIKKGTNFQVLGLGRVILKDGIVENGRIKNKEVLKEAVLGALSKSKPSPITEKKISFAISDSQVYEHIFNFSTKNGNKLIEVISEEARKSIPIMEGDLMIAHKILEKRDNQTDVIIVATSEEVILEWTDFFRDIGLQLGDIDIEPSALFRSLFSGSVKKPVCILDIGATHTKIIFYDKNGLKYSHTVKIAGNHFTNSLMEALGINEEKAEENKVKIGLSEKDKKIYEALVKVVDPLSQEILALLGYFERKNGKKIEEIVVVGGSSKMKGLVEYLKNSLKIPVVLGKSVVESKNNLFNHIQAIGSALRPLLANGHNEFVFESPIESKKYRKSFGAEKIGSSSQIVTKQLDDTKTKSKKSKIVLLVVVLVGIILIVSSFIFRNWENNKKNQEILSKIQQYKLTQSFNLTIPVAVDSSEYTDDRVRGRLVSNVVDQVSGREGAISNSKSLVEKEILNSEEIWPIPVSVVGDEPVSISWVVYNKDDVNSLYITEIDKINSDNIDYLLSNIKKEELEPTSNTNIYYLKSNVAIYLDILIKNDELVEPIEPITIIKEIPVPIDKILIGDTGLGWLNVREGSGGDYSIIDRVNTGDSYLLLEEENGWYKIQLSNESSGWVSAEYASKI